MSKTQLYWETLKAGLSDKIFIAFILGIFATFQVSFEAGIIAIIAYVGTKTLINITQPIASSDKQLTIFEHICLSTRTYVGIAGLTLCYIQTPHMWNHMGEIAIAYASGWGADQVATGIKIFWASIDWSKFNKTPNIVVVTQPATPIPNQPPVVVPDVPPAPPPLLEAPIILVKDTLESRLKLIESEEAAWLYLKGSLKSRIDFWMNHMLQMNPELKTIEAVKQIAEKYLNIQLTPQDCSNINAWMGLPDVIHAATDVDILATFEQLAKAGRLPKYKVDEFMNMARIWMCIEIINGSAARVKNHALTTEVRRRALQEFGLSPEQANKAQFNGGVKLVGMGGYAGVSDFNPYILVNRPELEKWAANY